MYAIKSWSWALNTPFILLQPCELANVQYDQQELTETWGLARVFPLYVAYFGSTQINTYCEALTDSLTCR